MSYNGLYDFYKSSEWESLRKQILLERVNANGDLVCEHSGKVIVNRYDAICHHIVPLDETNVFDYNVSLNPSNIMIVSHKAHNEIHNRFGSYNRHIYLVCGCTRSGKSTYVMENALKDDLIVDIDRIFDCINTNRSQRLYSNVMQIYATLIDMVKTRNGRWVNAWVMRQLPLASERERIAKELNAEIILIDTPKEICLERCKNDFEKQLVFEFFEKFSTSPQLS